MNAVSNGEQVRSRSLVPAAQTISLFEAVCETTAIVLLAVWLLAVGVNYTLGGYIHFLLLGAGVLGFLRFRRRRETIISA